MTTLKVGDAVKPVGEHPFPGVIVAMFRTSAYRMRIVVECTTPGIEGCLHIYTPSQLVRGL